MVLGELSASLGKALERSQRYLFLVPTIVVFNEGEEQERFQANIMMTMDATIDEVQEAVDDIMLNDF